MTELDIIIRLLVATILGGVIGYERERSRKIAGLRTHALVALGSAVFVVISLTGFEQYIGITTFDPSRIVSNILVGIGFIGAGAILRNEERVIGTTTAATLWAVAAVGAAAGLGLFYTALFATVIAYLILTVLRSVEKKLLHKGHKRGGAAECDDLSVN